MLSYAIISVVEIQYTPIVVVVVLKVQYEFRVYESARLPLPTCMALQASGYITIYCRLLHLPIGTEMAIISPTQGGSHDERTWSRGGCGK